MKTIGERIRQAREARGFSGEELALAVGYTHQSAIGNLENRATGTGGTKIAQIATALRVPVQWLLQGPDGPDVPFSDPMFQGPQTGETNPGQPPNQLHQVRAAYTLDASIEEATQLFVRLNTSQRVKAIAYMQALTTEGQQPSETADGNGLHVPHQKAA
jgi:transcriptional regulator with XRE-family HTH domain